MKKSRAWLALLPLIPGSALAQSSVTLYGIVDAGIEYINSVPNSGGGGSSLVRMSTGNLSTSRWGLRGVEDLGGGLKGVFVLENGFDLDTGSANQGGRLFGRQAFVGLQQQFGTLTFGRHQNLLYDFSASFDPMVIATRYSVIMHDKWMSGRADNSIKFYGASGPVNYGLLYSTGYDSQAGGEIPGAYKAGKEWSASLGYASGPFAIGSAYDEARGSTVALQDNVERRATLGLSYQFGPAKVLAGYRYYHGIFDSTGTSLLTNLYWAGVQYRATPALTVTGAVYYTDVAHTSADPYSFVLSGSYALSKRTDLYTILGYAKNRDGSGLSLTGLNPSLNPAATTLVNTSAQVANGENQFGAIVGVRHRF
ncbi:hypothetical protein BKK81_30025 [Cupriavidus sp. USMAHM13]|uniref:porin n=1 Tax=Cupriavidus sp. USMAHM13 TaxID=1389192 RepID=UPI0008A6F037|nr:porin [Cupriavidus sp. USMAHM13]AOZ03326.1 hypothetical protein BKK81_30025 [Cupriavidus sp. USMAHM13]